MKLQLLSPAQLARYCELPLLQANAAERDFRVLCEDAKQYGFWAVAVNPAPVRFCKQLLADSGIQVGAAIGFPLGQSTIETKLFETENAIENGADAIDYVINITQLKAGNYPYITEEMERIVGCCKDRGAVSTVIFENCFLRDDEKKVLCECALRAQPDFLKTSTGFGVGGATAADVQLMKTMVGDTMQVKAAGGIRTLESALTLIELGVGRISSSASKEIVDTCRRFYGDES